MYLEAAGVRSCPPSHPRNGTTSFTVTASLTRGLRVLPHQRVKSLHFVPTARRERVLWLGCLGRIEIRQHQASEVHVVFPFVTSCRRSSMRQWQICTSLHAVRSSQSLLRNKQITSVASLMAHSNLCTTGRLVLETWKLTTSSLKWFSSSSPLVLVNFCASSCWLQADCYAVLGV